MHQQQPVTIRVQSKGTDAKDVHGLKLGAARRDAENRLALSRAVLSGKDEATKTQSIALITRRQQLEESRRLGQEHLRELEGEVEMVEERIKDTHAYINSVDKDRLDCVAAYEKLKNERESSLQEYEECMHCMHAMEVAWRLINGSDQTPIRQELDTLLEKDRRMSERLKTVSGLLQDTTEELENLQAAMEHQRIESENFLVSSETEAVALRREITIANASRSEVAEAQMHVNKANTEIQTRHIQQDEAIGSIMHTLIDTCEYPARKQGLQLEQQKAKNTVDLLPTIISRFEQIVKMRKLAEEKIKPNKQSPVVMTKPLNEPQFLAVKPPKCR